MKPETIILPTIQHTGTWFLIELFKSLEKKVELWETGELDCDVRQVHICRGFHGVHHVDDKKFWSPEQLWAHQNHKYVIPLRDPMASVLTRWKRHPNLKTDYILHTFNFLPTLDQTGNTFFFPIDTDQNKMQLYLDLIKFCGFDPTSEAEEYIQKWEAQNKTPECELDKLYQDQLYFRDMSLLEPETILFLKKYGYNCYWFSNLLKEQ